jgi:hypothetical protein
MTSAYEQNRLNLNNSRNIDPNRFKDQMDTVKKIVNPEDPTFISELFLDLKTGYTTFKNAPGGLYIKGGSALGAIGLRRLIKKADIPQKVYTNFNNLRKLTEIGERLERQVPNFKTADQGVVQFLNTTNVDDVLVKNSPSANAANEMLGYTRPDAVRNLQLAGLNPPKGGGLYGRKRTRRTLQGPVPPQLPDKTTIANSYEEAIMLGTTKFEEGGVVKQIRNYASDTAPHGRVTGVGVRKTSGRGTFARLEAEKLLTLGDDVKGFYSNKIPGHDDAHHWNPIGIMKKVVDGLPKAKRNKFIQEIQDELGLFSGNHIANLRQLSPDVHRWLHRRLEALGYNPASLKTFKGKSVQARKAYLKKFADDLNELDKELFSEMQISKGNIPGPKLQ